MISYLLALILERQTACLYWVHHDGNIITFQLLDSGPDPMFLFSLVTFSYWSKVKCYASFNQLRLLLGKWKYLFFWVKIFCCRSKNILMTCRGEATDLRFFLDQTVMLCNGIPFLEFSGFHYNSRVKVNGSIKRRDEWTKFSKFLQLDILSLILYICKITFNVLLFIWPWLNISPFFVMKLNKL